MQQQEMNSSTKMWTKQGLEKNFIKENKKSSNNHLKNMHIVSLENCKLNKH